MLDVRRMRVLREVAQRGSFSAAAEALSFTQSAVSQQIAALEREAGTTLVQRSVRGVRLTDAGRALVRHTDAILGRLTEAEAELEAIAGLRGGRVRMAAFESAGATLMPLAIASFRERHPAVELTLSLAEPLNSLPKLKSGELELALSFDALGIPAPHDDAIDRTYLIDDPLYLALSAEHPLAHKRNLRLSDLPAEAWISGSPGCACNVMLQSACTGAGFEPRIVFESDDYAAIQGFVAAGVGVALIAELALTTVREDVVIRSLRREMPVRRIYAATLAGYRSPATAAMLEILAGVAEGYERRRPELTAVG
jgi:DNA-binding transcriptional LysR family regulator